MNFLLILCSVGTRLITFGQNQMGNFNHKPMMLTATSGSLSILLRRDTESSDSLLSYDIMLVKCQCMNFLCEMNSDANLSVSFTVQRYALVCLY
jgi:hypothetical protein